MWCYLTLVECIALDKCLLNYLNAMLKCDDVLIFCVSKTCNLTMMQLWSGMDRQGYSCNGRCGVDLGFVSLRPLMSSVCVLDSKWLRGSLIPTTMVSVSVFRPLSLFSICSFCFKIFLHLHHGVIFHFGHSLILFFQDPSATLMTFPLKSTISSAALPKWGFLLAFVCPTVFLCSQTCR